MKTCNCCNESLNETEFVKNRRMSDGLNSRCKSCCREYKKKYYAKNRGRITAQCRSYREKNRSTLTIKKREYNKKNSERNRQRSKEYYQRNKEKIIRWQRRYNAENASTIVRRNRVYRQKNYKAIRDKQRTYEAKNANVIRAYKREWTKANRARITKSSRDRTRIRMKDPVFRLKRNLRTRLHHALAGLHKKDRTMNLVGCSIENLKKYIESKFQQGMSWENYGKWHVDHIRPCASFDLSDPHQQEKCFHYSNLQPLWAEDNLRKQATYDPLALVST